MLKECIEKNERTIEEFLINLITGEAELEMPPNMEDGIIDIWNFIVDLCSIPEEDREELVVEVSSIPIEEYGPLSAECTVKISFLDEMYTFIFNIQYKPVVTRFNEQEVS